MKVDKGNTLVIPAPNYKHKKDDNKVAVHWQQLFMQREGDYYLLIAKNKSKGNAEVPIFIQSEWYNEQRFNSTPDMTKIDEDNYELVISDKQQYAGNDENQFVIWHDKDRKPFAHRFLDAQTLKNDNKIAGELSRMLGGPSGNEVGDLISTLSKTYIGNPLQTF